MTNFTGTTDFKLGNILNNDLAIKSIRQYYDISTIYFTNQQIADFYDVDLRTIERIIEAHKDELVKNDLQILKGQKFKLFKDENPDFFATDIFDGSKVTQLTVSTFRTVLNFAMLLKNSEKATEVRVKILDITMQVLQEKTKGNTKFINQRDIDYLKSAFSEDTERKKFTNALNKYVDMNQYKYAFFTDEIYKSVFKENSKEYREILKLDKKDKTRATMYSEVLRVIASFEAGFAYELERTFNELKRKLKQSETLEVLQKFTNHPAHRPHLEDARARMASRDLDFRDAYHENFKKYIANVSQDDYERFLGEKSSAIESHIARHLDVFERLRDK